VAGLFKKPVIRLSGDRGLLVEFGDAMDPEINRKVRAMFMALTHESPGWVVEVIPTYRSLVILYDPIKIHPREIEQYLEELSGRLSQFEIPPPATTEIPVCYGEELGPDLPFVAENNSLTPEEVIKLHSEPSYQIFMIGFTPGFPFLGGLSEALFTPRLETPRTAVPAGSVGIANNQTGIYPIESPGGWQLIGRTPVKLFDPSRENPFLLKAGDLLKFRPISREEYDGLAQGEAA
jgi:KipI family sensor histidine kinase inhibitor